jgi:hypothetical protein
MQSPISRALAFRAFINDREMVLWSTNHASHSSTLSPSAATCDHLLRRIPRFYRRLRDSSVISQLCLCHSAKDRRQKRQFQRSNQGNCEKAPWTRHGMCCIALERRIPSFQYAIAVGRALSKVTTCNGLRLLPHFSHSILTYRVSCSFRRILNRSFDDAIVMQIVICDSYTGQNRPFLSQISPDQGI